MHVANIPPAERSIAKWQKRHERWLSLYRSYRNLEGFYRARGEMDQAEYCAQRAERCRLRANNASHMALSAVLAKANESEGVR